MVEPLVFVLAELTICHLLASVVENVECAVDELGLLGGGPIDFNGCLLPIVGRLVLVVRMLR